jgi:hypothetical protein
MNRSVSLTLTADDYVAANRLHLRNWYRSGRVLAAFALAALAYLILLAVAYLDRWGTAELVALNAGAAAFIVFCMAIHFLFVPITTRRAFRNHKTLHRPCTYAWSETGLTVANVSGEWLTAWSDYLKWREDAQVFIFYQAPRLFNMLPKRVLTPQQMADLRQCAGGIAAP